MVVSVRSKFGLLHMRVGSLGVCLGRVLGRMSECLTFALGQNSRTSGF
jgi:hypothetical protein